MRPIRVSASAGDTLAYVRVSTEDQAADHKTSLEDQRRAIAARAQHLGRTVGRVFEDAGASGATAEKRRGFTALIAFCRAHPRPRRDRGLVLVLNDSRWGRFENPDEETYWRFELERHGWIVRFVEGEADDPLARRFLRTIHSTQASAYREAIRANAKRGARGTAAQGFWGNEAPVGYRRQVVAGGPRRTLEPGQRKAPGEKVRLVPAPAAEVALVRHCFEAYAAGTTSLGALARWLRARDPRRKWSCQYVQKVLRNPAYLGHVVWCRRPHDALERAEHYERPREQWVITERAHAPLVAPALFDQVQARLAFNARALRRTAGGYALSGLLTCTCGRPYIGGGGPKGPPGDPDRYRFYRCSGQKDIAWTCAAPSGILPRRLIEPAVVQAVGDVAAAAALTPESLEELDALLAADVDAQPERSVLERRRDELAAEQQRLVDAIARGVLDAPEAAATLERIRADRAAVAAALEQHRFGRRQAQAQHAERDQLLALARDFQQLAARLHGLELRELLRPWIAGAVVDLTARKVTLTLRRIPQARAFILSSTQAAPGGEQQKLIVRRTIALPPARPKKRRTA